MVPRGKLALCLSPLAHADGRQASTTQACRLRPFIVDEQRGEINQAIADSANIVGLTIPLLQGSRFEAPCITEGDGLMSAKKVCDKRQMENRGRKRYAMHRTRYWCAQPGDAMQEQIPTSGDLSITR
jgi:hypothetical protein